MARTALLIIIVLLFYTENSSGKISGVIADMETHKPIKNVKIYTNNNQTFTTDYQGKFFIPKDFSSVTITHPSYLKRIMERNELNADTTFMLGYTLNEVVIYGKSPYRTNFKLKSYKDTEPLERPSSPSGKDFLGWLKAFDGCHHPSKKEHEKNEQIWKNY